MAQANKNDTVRVHYTGTLADGSVFDSSEGRDPLEFQVGQGQVIPGFDEAVEGMEIGDKVKAQIEAENAYGEHREELLFSVPAEHLPEDMEPAIGDQLQVSSPDGATAVVSIQSIGEAEVTLDANHPLAGKDLTFEIELVEIV